MSEVCHHASALTLRHVQGLDGGSQDIKPAIPGKDHENKSTLKDKRGVQLFQEMIQFMASPDKDQEGRKDSWGRKNIVTHPFIWGAPLISRRKTEHEQTAGTCACIVRQVEGKVTAAQRREVVSPVHRHVHFHGVVQLREFNQESENRYISEKPLRAGKYQDLMLPYQLKDC